MPRVQSIKCVETVLFLGLFILVGHLSINFWERYKIQNEVNDMKFSLYKLKETIMNIGKTYDNLHRELRDTMRITNQNQWFTKLPQKRLHQKRYDALQCKNELTLDKRKLLNKNFQVQATLIAKRNDMERYLTPETCNKITETFERVDKKTGPLGKNATTITRYPPKSFGVTTNFSKKEIEICANEHFNDQDIITPNIHRCYRYHHNRWNR